MRREIARIALEVLLKDGRIHPASIEDAVIFADKQMDETILDLGETALMKLRLSNVHPEVVRLFGKLNFDYRIRIHWLTRSKSRTYVPFWQ